MKTLKKLIKSIWIFIICLTPKGKDKVFYDTARENMEESNTLSELEKRMLQSEINFFINHQKGRRILTEDQKILLIQDRFGKKLKGTGFKIDPTSKRLVHA